MAIRFPLEMKNGIQVRNINDLKENYDTEKVVGYFLEGKLMTWLEARYYEEEAELVSKLDRKDPEIAKKLCEIFDVKYEGNFIDTDEIEKRNERIQMIKQITDDEEVLKNIDSVALNQEELASLYDRNIQTIYLCKGTFSIPKSKSNLIYKEYGNPEITWSKEVTKKEQDKCISNSMYSHYYIPKKVADSIFLKNYVITDDYIVYAEKKEHHFWDLNSILVKEYKLKILDKRGNVIRTIDLGDTLLVSHFRKLDMCKLEGNKIIVTTSDDNVVLYDIDTDNSEVIGINNAHSFSAHNRKIIYLTEGSNYLGKLQLYDLDTRINSIISRNVRVGGYVVCNNEIFYVTVANVCFKYNIQNHEVHEIYKFDKDCTNYKLYYCYDVLYIYYESKDNDNLIGLSLNEVNVKKLHIFEFNKCAISKIKNTSKYIAYCYSRDNYPIYIYNMESKSLRRIASGNGYINTEFHLNDFSIVEDYLYYEKGESKEKHSVDLISGEDRILN